MNNAVNVGSELMYGSCVAYITDHRAGATSVIQNDH
jgi:hypothetical protein